MSPLPAAWSVPWSHPKACVFSSGGTGVSQRAGRDRVINASQLNELCALRLPHPAAGSRTSGEGRERACPHQLCIPAKGDLTLPPRPVIFSAGLRRKDLSADLLTSSLYSGRAEARVGGSARESHRQPLLQTPVSEGPGGDICTMEIGAAGQTAPIPHPRADCSAFHPHVLPRTSPPAVVLPPTSPPAVVTALEMLPAFLFPALRGQLRETRER